MSWGAARLGVLELLDRPHLDAPEARGREPGRYRASLVDVLGLDEEEPAQLLLRLRERAVGGGQLAPPDPHRRRRLDRREGLGHDELAAPPESLIVRQALVGAGLRLALGHRLHLLLDQVDQAHVLHRLSSALVEWG